MTNQVILCGFVVDDPFIRATEGGKLARLRLMTIEPLVIAKSGVVRRHTEWHTITLWGEYADKADREVRIGTAIRVEGALRTREWIGRDGTKQRVTEIAAKTLVILEGGIDGYQLPQSLIDKMPPQRATCPLEKSDIGRPADDPDNLPF